MKIKIMCERVFKNKMCFEGNHCYTAQCSLYIDLLDMYNVFAFRMQ